MLENSIHRLPVVQGGRLLGLISSMDVVRYVAELGGTTDT
jgi:CBS domain-containing protein